MDRVMDRLSVHLDNRLRMGHHLAEAGVALCQGNGCDSFHNWSGSGGMIRQSIRCVVWGWMVDEGRCSVFHRCWSIIGTRIGTRVGIDWGRVVYDWGRCGCRDNQAQNLKCQTRAEVDSRRWYNPIIVLVYCLRGTALRSIATRITQGTDDH